MASGPVFPCMLLTALAGTGFSTTSFLGAQDGPELGYVQPHCPWMFHEPCGLSTVAVGPTVTCQPLEDWP